MSRLRLVLAASLLATPAAGQEMAGRWSSLTNNPGGNHLWTEVNLWRDGAGWAGTVSYVDMTTQQRVCAADLSAARSASVIRLTEAGCGGGTLYLSRSGEKLRFERMGGATPPGRQVGELDSRGAPSRGQGPAPESGASGPIRPIRVGQTLDGRLERGDPVMEHDGTYYDDFALTAQSGGRLRVTLRSSDFDAYLFVGVQGQPDRRDDDGGGGTDSRLDVDVRPGGTILIRANALSRGMQGAYTLTVEQI